MKFPFDVERTIAEFIVFWFVSGVKRLSKAGDDKPSKRSELLVGSERIDRDTEFVILASPGIWEVSSKSNTKPKKKKRINCQKHT